MRDEEVRHICEGCSTNGECKFPCAAAEILLVGKKNILPICGGCIKNGLCEAPCAAANELLKGYLDVRTEERTVIMGRLRPLLGMNDYEVADDLRELAEAIINRMPHLQHIPMFDIHIGYVRSYEEKVEKGKIIFADCTRVKGVYSAFMPYNFLITFYEPNITHMNSNQRKVLMLHELQHVGMGKKGPKLELHDIEDFSNLLKEYGLFWNMPGGEVPDILDDGKEGKEGGKKTRQKERKKT